MNVTKTASLPPTKKITRRAAARNAASSFSCNNKVELIHCGKEFFDFLEKLIDEAETIIHLQTYILEEGEIGNRISEALMRAASRKVQVYLLVDGFASQSLSKEFREKMKSAGVHFRFFEPLLRSKNFYFGRRLHHKVVVVDFYKALVGSMNIADKYYDTHDAKAWFDMALYVEGETGSELHKICNKLWASTWNRYVSPPSPPSRKENTDKEDGMPVRIRRNDWVQRQTQASRTYFEIFKNARKNITIVSSYFLPGMRYKRLLVQRARNDVKIRIMLAGTSDIIVVKWAERYLYRWMLRNKMEVYEYKPVVLHSKMATMDGEFMTLGSYNINELSEYASIELNLDVKDKKFVSSVDKEIDEMLEKDCDCIDLKEHIPPLFSPKQLLYFLSFYITRIMIKLTTFYFRKRE